MFIIDLNQVMISNLMMTLGNHASGTKIEPDLLRHFVLNSIRGFNVKFKSTYGEMVIACDDTNNWRKTIFPYYKANRKVSRDSSDLDWNAIFQCLNMIREELKEYFPYRVIQVASAEADDVIGTLVQTYASLSNRILIISGDKDFKQLQAYPNVEQYDPVQKKWLKEPNPTDFLKEHIIRGDSGDGVPNFLSPDDSLVLKIRQKPISKKNLDVWLKYDTPEEFLSDDQTTLARYKRNQQMIDLSFIPDRIKEEVLKSYHSQENKPKDKLFDYFVKNRLKNLITDISQFA